MRAGQRPDVLAHFVGSIVYVQAGLYQVTSQPPLLVIDGQQRLTSVMLILEALARALGDEEPVDGFSSGKVRSYFLLNPLEKGDRRYKLQLTQGDRATLLGIMQQKPMPDDGSMRVIQNFALFKNRIAGMNGDLKALCNGLAKLMVVDISLTRDQDNPQLIFESMTLQAVN